MFPSESLQQLQSDGGRVRVEPLPGLLLTGLAAGVGKDNCTGPLQMAGLTHHGHLASNIKRPQKESDGSVTPLCDLASKVTKPLLRLSSD